MLYSVIKNQETKNVVLFNTTPHPLTMQNDVGELTIVEQCGLLVNASMETSDIDDMFQISVAKASDEGRKAIEEIQKFYEENNLKKEGELVILGSMIAVQAYPGKIAGLVPVPGYERVAPAEKRMRADKFNLSL